MDAPQWLSAVESFCLDGVAHGVGMYAQFAGDRADLPMLGVKVAANLRVGFRADHEIGLTFVVECVETDR